MSDKRKIVQIGTANQFGLVGWTFRDILALCNDGTLWKYDALKPGWVWVTEFAPIPQPPEKEDD